MSKWYGQDAANVVHKYNIEYYCPIWHLINNLSSLTVIWVGFLGVHFEVGDKITPLAHHCLKRVRIMLGTSNLARKYTAIFSFGKYTF